MSMVYEMKTEKNVDQAIESLEASLKDLSFGVLWKLNFKETLEGKGLEFKNNYVALEVCNPMQAKRILELNSQAGYVLPCKMIVREEDGQTYVGMTSPKALIGTFNDAELDKVAQEVEETLKKAIEVAI